MVCILGCGVCGGYSSEVSGVYRGVVSGVCCGVVCCGVVCIVVMCAVCIVV